MKSTLKDACLRLCAIGCALLSTSSPAIAQGSARASAESVVQVTCRLNGKQLTSTGFVWSKPDRVVTALHGVAGCDSIEVYSEKLGVTEDAKLEAAHRESDLALLLLESGLDLAPLTEAPVAPGLQGQYFVWGYPRAIPSLKGDPISFSMGLSDKPTLGRSFFKTEADFRRQVGEQGYPAYHAEIMRIGSIIQPGHSGAPILNSQGRVVAIADGGLYKGTAGINWSIPAATYLPSLATSQDPIPRQPSRAAVLMSSTSDQPASIEFDFKDGTAGRVESTWRIPVTELADLVFEEDLEGYYESMQTLSELAAEARIDINSISLDIYEDFDTGATIAVPSQLALEWDPESGYLQIYNENESAAMVIAIMRTDSWADANEKLPLFAKYIDSIGSWEVDPESGTDQDRNDQERWLWFATALTERDADGDEAAFATVYIRIDDSDLLATAVLQLDYYEQLSVRDQIDLELLWLAERLTNFAEQ